MSTKASHQPDRSPCNQSRLQTLKYRDTCFHPQLPEETATSLRANNVSCSFRDSIVVKGVKEKVRTYLVDLDEDLHIVPVTSEGENAEEVQMEK